MKSEEQVKELQVLQEENDRLRNEIKALQEYKEKAHRELCRVTLALEKAVGSEMAEELHKVLVFIPFDRTQIDSPVCCRQHTLRYILKPGSHSPPHPEQLPMQQW